MATVWERAANSVYYIFSLYMYYDYFYFKLFPTLVSRVVLITSAPGN